MAVVKWKGGAQAVAQVTTITFSAYTSGQTYTVVINGKSVSYTAAASTAADVSSGLQAAIAASGGAEFSTMTASGTTSLILTSNNPGEPTTITASATGGITATVTATTAATGPNHFDNANNWIGGALPSAGDDLVFEDSSYGVLYALEDTDNYGDITIDSTFTGEIGLPVQNATGYREYRPRFLKLGDGTSSYALTVGLGTGRQPPRVFIDANLADVTAKIYNSGNSATDEMPIVLKNTGSASTLDVYAGKIHVDADSAGDLANLRITPADGGSNNVYVLIDEAVDAGVIVQTGGVLEVRGVASSIDASNNAQARFVLAAACPIIVAANGATVYWESTAGVTTSISVHARGSVDFARNGAAKTVAAAVLYASGSITDPLGIVTWTTGVDLLGCGIQDVTLNLGRGRTITPS